jgi:hypothetical protein
VRHEINGKPTTAWLSREVPGLGVARLDLPNGTKLVAMRVGHDGQSTFPPGVEPKTTMFGPDSAISRAIKTLDQSPTDKDGGWPDLSSAKGFPDAGQPYPALKPYRADAGG